MKKKALIIGISGQDGAYLAKLLLEKGYEVYGTSRNHKTSLFSNLIKLKIKDKIFLRSMILADFNDVFKTLKQVQPYEIYNLAGQSSVGVSFSIPRETFQSVSVGSINILESLRLLKQEIRFFNAGSSEIFGNIEKPANEKTSFKPKSPYAVAKVAAYYSVENYRESYGLYACTGILFNHESPLRSPQFVSQKIISTAVRIAKGSQERLKLGNLAVYRDWGWAPEYVEAMWKMLQCSAPEDIVIATGQLNSLESFVKEAFSQLGLKSENYIDTDPSIFRPYDIEKSVGDASKAARILNWKATLSLKEVVAEMIKHA